MGIQECGEQCCFPVGLGAAGLVGGVAAGAAGLITVEESAAECSQIAEAYDFCVDHIGLRTAPYLGSLHLPGKWQSCPLPVHGTAELPTAMGTTTCSHRLETHCNQATHPLARWSLVPPVLAPSADLIAVERLDSVDSRKVAIVRSVHH